MTFTVEERNALKALDDAFGPLDDENPLEIEPAIASAYLRTARQYAVNAVSSWKSYEMAINPVLPVLKAKLLEEKRLADGVKLAERAAETRESLVSGIISGLMPKINRRLKNAKTSFFIGEDSFELYTATTDERAEIDFVYNRRDFSVLVRVNDLEFREDWTALSGNRPPREQSAAYGAIVDFLEGEGEGE